jgi:hypothetical protein
MDEEKDLSMGMDSLGMENLGASFLGGDPFNPTDAAPDAALSTTSMCPAKYPNPYNGCIAGKYTPHNFCCSGYPSQEKGCQSCPGFPASTAKCTSPPCTAYSPPGGGCEWGGEVSGSYIAGCSLNCKAFDNLASAKARCSVEPSCGGVTQSSVSGQNPVARYQLRAGHKALKSPASEFSWVIMNAGSSGCHPTEPPTPAPTHGPGPWPIVPDHEWVLRGAKAYEGLNRTDPEAIWSFQGWAFVNWKSAQQVRTCSAALPH